MSFQRDAGRLGKPMFGGRRHRVAPAYARRRHPATRSDLSTSQAREGALASRGSLTLWGGHARKTFIEAGRSQRQYPHAAFERTCVISARRSSADSGERSGVPRAARCGQSIDCQAGSSVSSVCSRNLRWSLRDCTRMGTNPVEVSTKMEVTNRCTMGEHRHRCAVDHYAICIGTVIDVRHWSRSSPDR